MTQRHPNILLIQSDQHRFDCVGANGNPLVQTPNLDHLAAQGTRFTHAFCPIPVCVPARNSLVYGQWATGHQAIANAGCRFRAIQTPAVMVIARMPATTFGESSGAASGICSYSGASPVGHIVFHG